MRAWWTQQAAVQQLHCACVSQHTVKQKVPFLCFLTLSISYNLSEVAWVWRNCCAVPARKLKQGAHKCLQIDPEVLSNTCGDQIVLVKLLLTQHMHPLGDALPEQSQCCFLSHPSTLTYS
eukprot:1161541-Pelagomonas_calceolata.AAC.2